MTHGRTEPNAEIRAACTQLWQFYCGLIQEGFTEEQALKLLGYSMSGNNG